MLIYSTRTSSKIRASFEENEGKRFKENEGKLSYSLFGINYRYKKVTFSSEQTHDFYLLDWRCSHPRSSAHPRHKGYIMYTHYMLGSGFHVEILIRNMIHVET